MNNFVKRLKLVFGIILLTITCASLVVYENANIANVGASSANLIVPTYSVGSEYAGTVTKQYVNLGDSVKDGQALFELKSDQLSAAIASGELRSVNLTNKLADDGAIILTAQHSGVIASVNYLKGSFVAAGMPLATIKSTDSASVRASFELSGPQYAKLVPNTPLLIKFGGTTLTAHITGISQRSRNAHTFTIVDATLPSISKGQTIYGAGTPLIAHMTLNTNTLYHRLRRSVQTS
jgi:multidrug efflux pump subunit AcrA (membrane-fusion protein)